MSGMFDDEWFMFRITFLCRHDVNLFHELLRIEEPSLTKVLATAAAWENATNSRNMAVPKVTYAVSSTDTPATSTTLALSSPAGIEEQILALPSRGCNNCGMVHGRGQCSAEDKKCFDCGKTGHLGRVCRARARSSSAGRSNDRGRSRFRRDTTPNRRQNTRSGSRSPVLSISSVIVKPYTPRALMACDFGSSLEKIRVVADSGAALTVFPRYLVPNQTPLYPSHTAKIGYWSLSL